MHSGAQMNHRPLCIAVGLSFPPTHRYLVRWGSGVCVRLFDRWFCGARSLMKDKQALQRFIMETKKQEEMDGDMFDENEEEQDSFLLYPVTVVE